MVEEFIILVDELTESCDCINNKIGVVLFIEATINSRKYIL